MPESNATGNAVVGTPRPILRRNGLVLFVLVSLYVLAGFGLFAWQAVQWAGSRPELAGRIEPLIGVASIAVLLGLVVFGTFLTLYLGRLSADLGRLQTRALEVAHGERSAQAVIERDDEVGMLARAIEKMASDLQARESEIAEARLEQFHNERMMLLGGIAAGLAHEIGNPVAAISAIASEVAYAKRAGRAAECDVEQLIGLAERLAAVTHRLATVAGPRSKQRAPVALNAVLESVAPLVLLDSRFRRVRIERSLDRDLPLLLLAEDDIVRLLLHLLVNAAEALAESGQESPRIDMTTRQESGWTVLEIADNGRGMEPEVAARAFEPFFTTKAAGRGSGLGLDACRRIVERYGGRIALESVAGKGTRVRCRLPSSEASKGVVL